MESKGRKRNYRDFQLQDIISRRNDRLMKRANNFLETKRNAAR